ncbi:MAG TPA: DUF6063 family protein [Patescibacteria group bacterium]|nr:DUF6063 family protein [Patescibacteria group bacterium]
MEHTKLALQIFRVLLEYGQLDRETNSELFIEYMNPDVLDVLNQFEEQMECRILRINNTIYLLPNYDNSVLGFKTKDMREWIGTNAKLSDIYLSYYIVMFILHQFYGGKNKNPKQREFIRISTFIDELDKRLNSVLELGEEAIEIEEKYSMNFIKLAESWDSRRSYEERKLTTKHGFAIRVCKLLEQEKLIRLVDDDKEIRTTRKLDDLMLYYYLNDSRINEINSIFERGEQKDASDQ